MEKRSISAHILELRAAFNRALSELAAVAESGAIPYEVRAAAMLAHINIAAKARETIAHLHAAITPSGVSGTMVKGADLVAALDNRAKRASNATAIEVIEVFKGSGEATDADAATYDYTYTDANGVVRNHAGLEVAPLNDVPHSKHSITSVDPAGPQHTERSKDAATPYVPPSSVTANWRRKNKAARDWLDVNG